MLCELEPVKFTASISVGCEIKIVGVNTIKIIYDPDIDDRIAWLLKYRRGGFMNILIKMGGAVIISKINDVRN